MSLTGFPGLAVYFLVISGFAAGVTALVLRHLRIIDVPNERSSHSAPTPRGGGLGIVLGFFLALTLIFLFGGTAAATPLRSLPVAGSATAACASTNWRGAKRLGLSSPMRVRTRKKVSWNPRSTPAASRNQPVMYHHSVR